MTNDKGLSFSSVTEGKKEMKIGKGEKEREEENLSTNRDPTKEETK